MFERFSKPLVLTVHDAVTRAHDDAQAQTIDEKHLVLALYREPQTEANLLSGKEIPPSALQESFDRANRRGGVSDADIAGLRELGIDVTALVDSIEQKFSEPARARKRRGLFGKQHLPFTEAAKLALAGALQEAQQNGDREITEKHLLLAVLRRGGLAAGVLAQQGLSYDEVHARLASGPDTA